MLCRTCWLRTKLCKAIRVWKSTFWSPIWVFPRKNSAKSVTNTVKNFTKIFWLWKSRTKASGPQVCWQTVAAHWRWMYLKPITGESHASLHFRGKFLPVSLVRKVLFCTNRVLCIFETLPDRKILCVYIYIYVWIQHKKYCEVHLLKIVGRKKKVKFCCQV